MKKLDDLFESILLAREKLLENEVEANTVILNGKKFSTLIKPGFKPTVFGMDVYFDPGLPDEYDFLVQRIEPGPKVETNADRIRSMTDEELASVITDDWCEIVCSGTYLCNDGTCEQHVLKWLKEEVKDGT